MVERAPLTAAVGGWVGPRAGVDALVKRKMPCTCRIPTPDRLARRLAAIHRHTERPAHFTITLCFILRTLIKERLEWPRTAWKKV